MQHKTYLGLGGLLAALALAGCSNNQPETPPTATTTVTTPSAATTTTTASGTTATTTTVPPVTPDTKINTNAGPGTSNGTDSSTADAVNTAIVHNKQMTGSRVEAVVTDGVARLTGTVQNRQQKGLAEQSARNVPGVSSVVNKLQVVSTGGAKSKPVVKIMNHTTVVNHYIQVPAAGSGAGGDTNVSGNTGSGTGGSGSGGNSTDSGGNSSNTTPAPAPSATPPTSSNP